MKKTQEVLSRIGVGDEAISGFAEAVMNSVKDEKLDINVVLGTLNKTGRANKFFEELKSSIDVSGLSDLDLSDVVNCVHKGLSTNEFLLSDFVSNSSATSKIIEKIQTQIPGTNSKTISTLMNCVKNGIENDGLTQNDVVKALNDVGATSKLLGKFKDSNCQE